MLLTDRGHQHGLALLLASLERRARVTHLAGEHQVLDIRQRFVDHHRLQRGCLVHILIAMRFQIARRGLLHVLDAVETGGRLLLHAPQKIDQVIDVGALLIEVERINPFRHAPLLLCLLGHAVHRQHAVDVPFHLIAIQLDLEVRKTVVANPLRQRFRQSIADPLLDVGVGDRVYRAHQVVERHARLGILAHVLAEVLAFEPRPQVVR